MFKRFFTEENVHYLKKFNIAQNRKKFKIVDHQYMIQKKGRMIIRHADNNVESIPLYKFNFIDFI